MKYFFESEIAGAVGVDAAVVLSYIYNSEDKKRFTKRELINNFGFYTESKMRRILYKLWRNSYVHKRRNDQNLHDSHFYYMLSDNALNIFNKLTNNLNYQNEGVK